MDKIIVKGARENNLKNVNIELPKNKLIVMTGLSGSGKSSLAFDTIYQEGERRFVESLSTYVRQFIGLNDKPDVDSIEGLSPAISIDQKSTSHNPRSTVGTVTEIYDYLRVLFARVGTPYCPHHHIPINGLSIDEVIDKILNYEEGSRVYIMAPIVKNSTCDLKELFKKYLRSGYLRALVDDETYMLDEENFLDSKKKHNVSIIIERLKLNSDSRMRVSEACETASKLSDGFIEVLVDGNKKLYSLNNACPICGYKIPNLEPRLFSFNSPLGACSECNGLGYKLHVSPSLIIDNEKSLNNGAIVPYRNQEKDNLNNAILEQTCAYYDIDMNVLFKDLPKNKQDIILYGSKDIIHYNLVSTSGRRTEKDQAFEGIVNTFERRYLETNSDWIREWIENFMVESECKSCRGARLNEQVLSIYIDGKNIDDLCRMQIADLYNFFANINLGVEKMQIGKLAIKEIMDRLKFLIDVGLDYLTLARSAVTLSGGEAQRIRLATQIGSQLTGVLYVLDEPSIGLHQRDNNRLIETLKNMRDLGNTLIVVEHDEETMMQADYLVDVGPKAGIHGGEIVACGTPKEVMMNKNSITGAYLRGDLKIEVPKIRRIGNGKFITIKGAKENNLKNINVKFPLGTFICVTGVSGSGKSTLVNQVLLNNCLVKLYKNRKIKPGVCKEILGLENIDRVIEISQQPIGRTPRSNPATYTGVFDDIRELFANTNEAKMRGYDKSRFSFNVKGGRCEACGGDGVKRISMHFLPDVFVPCEVCHGTRYQRETLEIKYKDKNIADVLNMRIEEAYEFFKAFPKIKNKLETLMNVGLGYMKLGQSSVTLSGGEAQRIKLASELYSKISPKTLYVLDEPSTGLHVDDVKRLLNVLYKIVDEGATLVVIEHNLDIIKCADYIIDLGKEGGDKGGNVIFSGTPEELVLNKDSYTGLYLKTKLGEK